MSVVLLSHIGSCFAFFWEKILGYRLSRYTAVVVAAQKSAKFWGAQISAPFFKKGKFREKGRV